MMPCWIWWLLEEIRVPVAGQLDTLGDLMAAQPEWAEFASETYLEFYEMLLNRRERRADPRAYAEKRMLEMSGMTQDEMDADNRRIWGPSWPG